MSEGQTAMDGLPWHQRATVAIFPSANGFLRREVLADAWRVDVNGTVPLHFACEENHLEGCKWLHKIGKPEDIRKAMNDSILLGLCTWPLVHISVVA